MNAALNSIIVIGRNMQHHRHQKFIRVLNAIETQVRARRQIHVIAGDCATPQAFEGARMTRPPSPLDVPIHRLLLAVILAALALTAYKSGPHAGAERSRISGMSRLPSDGRHPRGQVLNGQPKK